MMSLAPRSFAILPAAGRSLRMGEAKLRLPWQGGTVFDRVLRAWAASRVMHVVVVLHPDDADLAESCRRYGIRSVIGNPPPPDMKASVGYGLNFIAQNFTPCELDTWLVAPADMPLLTPAAIDAVVRHRAAAAGTVVVPQHKGRRGHPVRFPWSLAAEVATLAANEGLNSLVARHGVEELPLPDDAILADMDTPEDYRRMLERSVS